MVLTAIVTATGRNFIYLFIYYVIQVGVGGRGGEVSQSMTHYDREWGRGMTNYDV